MVPDYDLNTLDHEIELTVTVMKFNKYAKNYEEGFFNRGDDLNKTRLLQNYKFIHFLDIEDKIAYKLTP